MGKLILIIITHAENLITLTGSVHDMENKLDFQNVVVLCSVQGIGLQVQHAILIFNFILFIKNAVPLRLENESLNFYQICSYWMNVDYLHLQGKLE